MKKKGIIIGIIAVVVIAIVAVILLFCNKKVTISFDADGGSAVSSITIKKGESITLPDTEKEGYNLDGWFLNDVRVTEGTTFDKDSTLKAKWISKDAETFTVTFDSDGGSEVESIIVECGKELILPTNPTKSGYKFVSWIDEDKTTINDKEVLTCEDITLKAKWEKQQAKPDTKEKEYKCPSDYTLSETKCISETEKVKATESCKTGYTYSESRGLCYKAVDYENKCNSEETYIDGYCYSSLVTYSNDTQGHCEIEKFHYVGGKCYKTQTNPVKSCPSGYVDRPAKWADPSQTSAACLDSVATIRSCPSDYTQNGNYCYKTIDATLE